MTSRIPTNIAKTIAAAIVAAAVAAPMAHATDDGTLLSQAATRVTIPARFANFQEPGSTGYVPGATQVTIPSRFAHFHEPGSTGYVPAAASVTTVTTSGGLDWLSVLIGAGAALGAALASAGGMIALRKRRALAHV